MLLFFENLTVIIPIITFIGTLVILSIKILNRSKIEILLEDKFKRKLYDFIGFLFSSMIISISISAISLYEINISGKVGFVLRLTLVLILMLSLIFLVISIILLPIAVSIYFYLANKGRHSKKLLTAIKYNNIILMFSLVCIHLSLIYTSVNNKGGLEQVILIITIFAVLYLSLILFVNYLNTQSHMKKRELYQVSIIQEEINKELDELFYLYALGKERLIFVRKKDSNQNNLNNLSVFYVYDTTNVLLMKYESSGIRLS